MPANSIDQRPQLGKAMQGSVKPGGQLQMTNSSTGGPRILLGTPVCTSRQTSATNANLHNRTGTSSLIGFTQAGSRAGHCKGLSIG